MVNRRLVVASFAFAAASFVSSVALAQDPQPTPAAEATTERPAGVAAPAADAKPVTPTCTLGDHPGVPDADARTAADLVCHEIARQGAKNARHEIRFGVLGGQTLMTISSWSGNQYDERRTLMAGMGETPVAGPRLVSALVEGKPVEETRTVDNVLTNETHRAKQQQGTMGFEGTLFGTTGVGMSAGSSAGLGLGLVYRASNVGLSFQGRAGGIGDSGRKLSSATLDLSGRYYLSSSDIAPFVGGGFGLSHFDLNQPGAGVDGAGFGGHVFAGIELLRTHHAAFNASVRADLPFYKLEGASADGGKVAEYVVPLSFNVAMVFH